MFEEFTEHEIAKNPDGSFTVETSLPEGEWLLHYILSFGSNIEVLAPEHIRETIEGKLEDIILKYKK